MDLPLFFHLPLALNFLPPSSVFVSFLLCDFLTPNARALPRLGLPFLILCFYARTFLLCCIVILGVESGIASNF